MINQLIKALSALPEVEAIALGGSRAGTHFDEKSDYDIYVYCTTSIPEESRQKILAPYCSYVEYGNHFWELEDNGTFKSGIDFDILYRDLDDFINGVSRVVEDCCPQNAYTTCMWHNLLTCQILYDGSGRLAAAKERFHVPYPDKLRENILCQGWQLLHSSMPAYDLQIKKASIRSDLVSINHRIAAFLETYFDMLFALNRQTHPGEKRLMQLCRETCPLLPESFEENIELLFSHMLTSPDRISADLDRILSALEKLLH